MLRKPHRSDLLLLTVWLLLAVMATLRAHAGGGVATEVLPQQVKEQYARLSRLDNKSLLVQGERALGADDEELALTAFNLLTRRTARSQNPDDLHACAKALCHIGDI